MTESKLLFVPKNMDEILGVCWPEKGILADAIRWANKTTDADYRFHFGAWLPIFAHEATCARFHPADDIGFRIITWNIGQPASSKSTAWRQGEKFITRYRSETQASGLGGLIQGTGTESGLFGAFAEKWNAELGLAPGLLFTEEASALIKTDGLAEFLCQIGDGVNLHRHQRSIQQANKAKTGSLAAELKSYVFPMALTTTFKGYQTILKLAPVMTGGGFQSRALYFVGERMPKHAPRQKKYPDEYEKLHEGWKDWQAWAAAQTLIRESNGLTWDAQIEVQMPDECLNVRDEMLFPTVLDSRFNVDQIALHKRGMAQALTISSLFALSERRIVVEWADMARACRLVQLSNAGFAGLFPEMHSAENPIAGKVAQALETVLLGEAEGIYKRDLYKALGSVTKRQLDDILDTLVDSECVKVAQVRTQRRGRPPIKIIGIQFAKDADDD